MPVSAAMIDHLAGNVTTLCSIWKITATDSTVAAYAAHTRSVVFGGTTYEPAQVEPSRLSQRLGLDPNTLEIFGIFDSIITEANLQGGKWKNATVKYEEVNYLDLTMGSVAIIEGKVGEFTIDNGTFTLEVRSKAELLRQEIGDLTSPIDRNRRPEDLGVSMAGFTHTTTVSSVTNRQKFKVNYVQTVAEYFRYGRAEWTSGANNGLKMEIKSSTTTDSGTKTEIELVLPMRSNIVASDGVTLIAGYDGTREQARDRFAAAVAFNGEPDLPGIRGIIEYPE